LLAIALKWPLATLTSGTTTRPESFSLSPCSRATPILSPEHYFGVVKKAITRAPEADVVVESRAVAEYFARVFNADWETDIDPAKLPKNFLDNVNAALFRPDGFEEIPRI